MFEEERERRVQSLRHLSSVQTWKGVHSKRFEMGEKKKFLEEKKK